MINANVLVKDCIKYSENRKEKKIPNGHINYITLHYITYIHNLLNHFACQKLSI